MIPSILNFELGGYFGRSHSFELKNKSPILVYTCSDHNQMESPPISLNPSKEKWDRFLKECDRIDIWSWESQYQFKGAIMDGSHWSLHIEYGHQKVKTSGSNAYPGEESDFVEETPTFKAFKRAIWQLVEGLPSPANVDNDKEYGNI